MSSVNILGTAYNIIRFKYNEYPNFKKFSRYGNCDNVKKLIAVVDASTIQNTITNDRAWMIECEKEILRREVVHAYLSESGLKQDVIVSFRGWSKCEELIDWFAIMGKKISKTWSEVETWIDEIYKSNDIIGQLSIYKNPNNVGEQEFMNRERAKLAMVWKHMEPFSKSNLDEIDKIDRKECDGCIMYDVEQFLRGYNSTVRCSHVTGSVSRIATANTKKYLLHCDNKATPTEFMNNVFVG